METRRKASIRFTSLAAAWMLAVQAAWALDGSDKVPTLPASAAASISAWP
jgi:hypothetical protein